MAIQGLLYISDVIAAAVPLLFLLVVMAVAILKKGNFSPETTTRINRQDQSLLLNQNLMKSFYWILSPLGHFLHKTKASANFVSIMSVIFALLAGICFANGLFGWGAVTALCSGIMDMWDGLIARLEKKNAESGIILDSTLDRYSDFFLLTGLLFYYRFVPWIFILVLLTFLGSFMMSYTTAKAEALQRKPPRGNMKRPERWTYLILGASLSGLTIPFLEFKYLSISWLGVPMVLSLGLVGVLSNISAFHRFFFLLREEELG